jgi:signal transduction histidine kinase
MQQESEKIATEISPDPIDSAKKSLEASPNPVILCETKENNPNYLAIIYANQKFYEIFNIEEFNLIGKNYDFLFSDIDVDAASEEQLEYIRLIKDVKRFNQCSIIINIKDFKSGEKNKFKVDFNPTKLPDGSCSNSTFSFEKIEATVNQNEEKKTNIALVRNLERTLHNERLLREIGALIISDLPIKQIAQKISDMLCDYLKVDRCILHDYKEGNTSFVVESCSKGVKEMLKDNGNNNLAKLAEYINFQNNFYRQFNNGGSRNLLTIIEDTISDYNFTKIKSTCEEFLIISQIAVTTTFNGRVSGGIYIHQSSKRNWLADEIELIEMVSDQFSIAVDRSDSIEKVMIANHALMEKTAQLKEALKEEQKIRKMQNEFVALVSHEFKTPLQIIDSTRELLTRKLKAHNIKDESIDKSLEKIKSGIQRMNGLIHSTLNLAKMENSDNAIKVELEIFDLKKFILDIIEKNSNLATNKNIKVLTKIDELPSQFHGDPKLLEHSFTNIISNAIKYSKNDTTVRILAKANPKKVAIKIIDQGMGIPKDDISQIGTKFFRAKNTLSVAGTGIGLYLTKHFVELHGGSVLIESEVDVGTSVTVTLPIT